MTVWAAVVSVALCLVFALVVELSQLWVARHRAAVAADLAALAAAERAWEGPGRSCRLADRVARRNDARLTTCVVRGMVADLTTTVRAGPRTVRVRSRAGPPEAAVPAPPPEPPPGQR
ncbi:Rv3654c family TadE-like protein [Streptomyces sp. NPDC005438]|uniref:Rv3654c family TadE-like protein n=1 Tax=Streptomyces sp. NPDC005438 TaxID=3156880 RepID=UPI0033BD64A2